MNFLVKAYTSRYKYLILGYVFMFFGVYNVLLKNKTYYEMLFIISLTQFALFAFFTWRESRNNKDVG